MRQVLECLVYSKYDILSFLHKNDVVFVVVISLGLIILELI